MHFIISTLNLNVFDKSMRTCILLKQMHFSALRRIKTIHYRNLYYVIIMLIYYHVGMSVRAQTLL